MAKRDRDTAIWKDKFYRGLPPLYKCFWDFINDDCDNCGVWIVDFAGAKLAIGKKINQELAEELFGNRIQVFDHGNKWHIKTFVSDKLGFDELNPSHKFQKSIMDLLAKHKIQKNGVYPDTLQSVKERKGQEKGGVDLKNKKELVEKTDEFAYQLSESGKKVDAIELRVDLAEGKVVSDPKGELIELLFADEIYIESLQMTHRGKNIKQAFEECYIHFSALPRPPQEVWEWKQKLNTWLVNTKFNGTPKGNKQQHTSKLAASVAETYRNVFTGGGNGQGGKPPA